MALRGSQKKGLSVQLMDTLVNIQQSELPDHEYDSLIFVLINNFLSSTVS